MPPDTAEAPVTQGFPQVVPAGLDGMLIRFSDRLDEAANRAALAFRARVEAEGWEGVTETASTLASVFLRFDAGRLSHDALGARLSDLLSGTDWQEAALPPDRTLWHVPTAFGGEAGPQLAEAADHAGISADKAVEDLTAAPLRILALGFAPGQPYLGLLPDHWDIPRQSDLTRVPEGALTVAVRQLVLFANASPTGWRHVGQTAFRCFRPEGETPIPLRPGDEIRFHPVSPSELDGIRRSHTDGSGGARAERLS